MRFSEKYPQLFISAEEKLKTQVEAKGLDFEAVKKDAESGICYEVDFCGILCFGEHYALKKTPMNPKFIDYSEMVWAYGEKRGTQQDIDCIIIHLYDGSEWSVELNDKEDEKNILSMFLNANPAVMIGYNDENKAKYISYLESINIKVEEPKENKVPAPKAKLSQEQLKSLKNKFEKIISLSKKLTELDKRWKCKMSEPLNKEKTASWCRDNGVYLPEYYTAVLERTNGFSIGYSSPVGYFAIYRFNTDTTTKELYSRTKDEMLAREYRSYKHCQSSFGFLSPHGLYYNPYTGETYLKKGISQYTPVEDFEKEVLDEAICYLEKMVIRFERKDQLLAENINNPMRKMYDSVVELIEKEGDLNYSTIIYEPLTHDEIAHWEEEHGIILPQDYKNWLFLSNGLRFADKTIYGLEDLDTDNTVIGPDDNKDYIMIASLSYSSDCLVFDPETSELFAIDDDGETEDGDFFYHIFDEGFEYLENM